MDWQKKLYDLQDLKYRDFQIGLIPSADPGSIIGVRTPALRDMAKEMLRSGEYKTFLNELPHTYFEENQLQAFIISGIKDYDECMEELEKFLPYVDNWATCDSLSPAVFKKHRAELLEHIYVWLDSGQCYQVRFGVGMLMGHFLDADFDPAYLDRVAALRSEEYYVNMMIAWYFATALAKQYDEPLPYLEQRRLDRWTHNKTIQKAVESYRVSDAQKAYLRTLKRKDKEG